MKNRIIFINFWSTGGMRHYSDATVNVLSEKDDVVYISNYQNLIKCNNKIIAFSLNIFNFYNYIRLIYFIYCLIKIKPKFVHLNSGYPILLPIYPIFYFFNSVITVHDAISHEGEKEFKKLFHKIQLFLFSIFFKKIIVHSNKIKEQLPFFVSRKKVFIIPHISYNHLREEMSNNEKNKKDKFSVLFFGRILKYKGLEYLVKAFKKLDEEKYELIVAGEGIINFEINSKNIRIMNRFIKDEEMGKLFNWADVVVLPYISASQSGVIYLSFAFNKPVIVTNVGSMSDVVIDKFNGFLINPKSSKDIAIAIMSASNKTFYKKSVDNIKNQKLNQGDIMRKKILKVYEK